MQLWPFASTRTTYLWHILPNSVNGLSPSEIYLGKNINHDALWSEKTWGCPTYVLDPKLQDGRKLPKWDPRTRQGQYLGRSPKYTISVGSIRNLILILFTLSSMWFTILNFKQSREDMKGLIPLRIIYGIMWHILSV